MSRRLRGGVNPRHGGFAGGVRLCRAPPGRGRTDCGAERLGAGRSGAAPGDEDRAVRVGVDTGGTFTDVVTADGTLAKVPSDSTDPSTAVAAGLTSFAVTMLAHGTTVATNALLERRGAAVALITNAGLEAVIEIGRQNRPSLYDQWADRPEPLVPRAWRLGVAGRLAADGTELEPLDCEGALIGGLHCDRAAVVDDCAG